MLDFTQPVSCSASIATLNVNGINCLIKRLSDPTLCSLCNNHFRYKNTTSLKKDSLEKVIPYNQ
jgi:transposase-like protein